MFLIANSLVTFDIPKFNKHSVKENKNNVYSTLWLVKIIITTLLQLLQLSYRMYQEYLENPNYLIYVTMQ